MSAKPPEWTDKEIALLKAMFSENKEDSDIAKAVNKSVKAVTSKRKRLGLLKADSPYWENPWQAHEIEKMQQELLNGLNHEQIAKLLGRTKAAVSNKAGKLGLVVIRTVKAKFWTEERIQQLKDGLAAGKTSNQLAVMLNRTRRAIRSKLHDLGLEANQEKYVVEKKPPSKPPVVKIKPVKKVAAETPIVKSKPTVFVWEKAPQTAIGMMQLTETTCKWPFDDQKPTVYCGCQTYKDSVYCRIHHKRATTTSRYEAA